MSFSSSFSFSASLFLFLSLFVLPALVNRRAGGNGRLADLWLNQVDRRWRGPVAAETMQVRQGYAEFTTTKTA